LAVLRVDDGGIAAGIHNESYAFAAANQRQFDDGFNVRNRRKGARAPSHQMLEAEETANGQGCALSFGMRRTTVSALTHPGQSSWALRLSCEIATKVRLAHTAAQWPGCSRSRRG